MLLNYELEKELKTLGANFVYFVDISLLSNEQNKGYLYAIILGIVLSQDYIQKVIDTPDYVKNMVKNNQIEDDEFYQKEMKVDSLADYISGYLTSKGYKAYSQSEKNVISSGFFNEKEKSTPLPHKTIAGLAGIGWIGKHNLLVTPEYGSAICMCTVLTDAPLNTVACNPIKSMCGNCVICKDTCSVKAIKGNTWSAGTSRDELVDVFKCTTCLECLVHCPWTQKYMNKK
ncbi:MAG: epoxyqueuosine reductase [Desulfobacteraceae bacterium]|nr:MAG: epoxyqueuosine reductase [Desulfobacteraceae bacterium]